MLALRPTTLRPALTLAEALETTRLHRVAGLKGDRMALVATRPCRAPHHTISDAGLIGGGRGLRLSCVGVRSPPGPDPPLLTADSGLKVAGIKVTARLPQSLAPPP
jgi:Magnesium chelatase, subunit ChlI